MFDLPIEKIDVDKNTTFALLMDAQPLYHQTNKHTDRHISAVVEMEVPGPLKCDSHEMRRPREPRGWEITVNPRN